MGLIRIFCNPKRGSLKSLKLNNLDNIGLALLDLFVIFRELHTVKLKNITLPCSLPRILNNMSKAVNITIYANNFTIMTHRLSKLAQNLNLKKLKIACDYSLQPILIVKDIHEIYPSLTKLFFNPVYAMEEDHYAFHITNIAKLHNLQSLNINTCLIDPSILINKLTANGLNLEKLYIKTYNLEPI